MGKHDSTAQPEPIFDPLLPMSTPIPAWQFQHLHVHDEAQVQTEIGPAHAGCVIFVPDTVMKQTKLNFAKFPDNKSIRPSWYSAEVTHFHCWVYLITIARRITRNPDKNNAIPDKNTVAVETCKDLIKHCRHITNTYASIFLKASWDPEKGNIYFSRNHGKVKHMLNCLRLTGTDVICKQNGVLVREGIFLYQNDSTVWFISPPGGPPKLSSSLAEVDIFPEPAPALTDDHEDYIQNWGCLRFCSADIYLHGFELASSSDSDETASDGSAVYTFPM